MHTQTVSKSFSNDRETHTIRWSNRKKKNLNWPIEWDSFFFVSRNKIDFEIQNRNASQNSKYKVRLTVLKWTFPPSNKPLSNHVDSIHLVGFFFLFQIFFFLFLINVYIVDAKSCMSIAFKNCHAHRYLNWNRIAMFGYSIR